VLVVCVEATDFAVMSDSMTGTETETETDMIVRVGANEGSPGLAEISLFSSFRAVALALCETITSYNPRIIVKKEAKARC
jgi:hypothetical protein